MCQDGWRLERLQFSALTKLVNWSVSRWTSKKKAIDYHNLKVTKIIFVSINEKLCLLFVQNYILVRNNLFTFMQTYS
jgi:hypothetical protein